MSSRRNFYYDYILLNSNHCLELERHPKSYLFNDVSIVKAHFMVQKPSIGNRDQSLVVIAHMITTTL